MLKYCNNKGFSKSYSDSWVKYPQKLFDLFDKKLELSTAGMNGDLKERYGREGGKWRRAMDVGCGPGTSTHQLTPYFNETIGCDYSQSQIDQAKEIYATECGQGSMRFEVSDAACITSLVPSKSLDLLCVGSAIHWFDREPFYKQCLQVLRPGGLLIAYCHEVHEVGEEGKKHLDQYFKEGFGGYNDEQGKLIFGRYAEVEEEMKRYFSKIERDESVIMRSRMTLDSYKAYMASWPTYQLYKSENPSEPDPLDFYIDKLSSLGNMVEYSSRIYCVIASNK